MLLSILICTLPERKHMFDSVYNYLWVQIKKIPDFEIEVLTDDSKVKSIGQKRNDLIKRSTGKYTVFVDDDDMVYPDYIDKLMEGCRSDKDCVSLRGVITWNGVNAQTFEHSLKYKEWKTNQTGDIIYERYPNHLNAIKSSISKKFSFPEISHGEDHHWSTQLHQSGLIKSEHYIDKTLYHYQYISNK